MNRRDYICSKSCGLSATAKIGEALDRAPRPYTADELAEITGYPLMKVLAFLKCNKINDKINSHYVSKFSVRGEYGKDMLEYWRGQADIISTFQVDNMLDERTEDKIREGKRPVAWRDGNNTSWSIDEANTVATMRGSSVVRLGKLDAVSFSSQTMTLAVSNGMKVTFRKGQA